MPEDLNSNEPTQPLKPTSDDTQPIPMGKSGRTSPFEPERTASKIPAEIPTSPLKVSPLTSSPEPEVTPSQPRKNRRVWLILAGVLVILVSAAIGSTLGYQSGMQSRIGQQSSQVAMTAATQFQLGLDDLNGERYDLARTRFEYVIKLDPNFPGIQEKLAQTMIEMSRTEVPTETPTPTLTPTPDMRGEQELFTQIQQNLVAKHWDAAIQASETLRSKNLTYHTVDVDGMYYIALRYRGVDRILRLGDLEGGMYDLALVQRFGPLDRDADNYRLYARYYAIGASFWEVDWLKSISYFEQVAPFLPMLRDASGIAAVDRYRLASIGYAAQLMKDNDFCKADKILSGVLVNNYKNSIAEPLATRAFNECHPPTNTPQPSETATITPTITPTHLTPAAKTATPALPAVSATPALPAVSATPALPAVSATPAPPAPATATHTPPPSVATSTVSLPTAVPPKK